MTDARDSLINMQGRRLEELEKLFQSEQEQRIHWQYRAMKAEAEGIVLRNNLNIHAAAVKEFDQEVERLRYELEEGDRWLKRMDEYVENGHCPHCKGDDEGGHKEGCYVGEIVEQNDEMRWA
jgi:hypothetical protein